ncbi:MAG: phosphoribosylaminoimidazolesuccinocarboxamide synthase [Spirochaetales bacterium]|nr:MAG: phosphoribosylaminoimidazolesuccinocarboxamide synthase [Spirochaetales bacterium]
MDERRGSHRLRPYQGHHNGKGGACDLTEQELASFLPRTLHELDFSGIAGLKESRRGKVRDVLVTNENLFIITTDRISAFDRILTTIPCKGEVLNRLSLYWFRQTEDIIRNHIVKDLTARTLYVKKCSVLPVEVVVRGYLTGSAWRDYKKGRDVSGICLPQGLAVNQAFEKPLLTPSSKEELGTHDVPLSSADVVKRGLIDRDLWEEVCRCALALFKRGTEVAARRGLILVDTKYEFGVADGKLYLVDEIHTPDSSRYWFADSYQKLFSSGEDQRKLDKEYLRGWLMERGFMGDGGPPVIPDDIRLEVARRYIQAYTIITGEEFVPKSLEPAQELSAIRQFLALAG